jgi:putative tryptophan/tyrosine transport system substrate-binding protein
MASYIERRKFLATLGSAAAWPLAAQAQQAAMPAIGVLIAGTPEAFAPLIAAFRKGLQEIGYVEGQNVAIEYRWANNENNRLPELAADLVRRRVGVIVTPVSTTAALAAKDATATIPVVFSAGADPVQAGLVASLNRPGGNVTGVHFLAATLGAKRLGLLHELRPEAARFAILVNPSNPVSAETMIKDVTAAAATIGRQIEVVTAGSYPEIDTAFTALAQKRVDALLVMADPLFLTRRVQLATLASRHVLPAIYPLREFAEAGGLMSYGSNQTERFRQVGIYTGRILKGAKPADLPVLQATVFELVINLQTARALGIDIPATLIARADEVIE